uniref:Class I SAM-dependent methyltransferase n=1 Tax=Candidatus Desulfatibia profunda TaxID=2841695 RepID=A0A8J6TLB6_9BACT|nr:class I SAM-dependent methyltransferase [Candidatus Desulfatibia profunda]
MRKLFRELSELVNYHQKHGKDFAAHDRFNVFEKAVKKLDAWGFPCLNKKTVLDLGCGQRFPFALQCAASGAQVTAIDLNYVKPSAFLLSFFKMFKHNGVKRACKSILRRLFFDGAYYKALEASAGLPLRKFIPEIDFVVADPESGSYPLPSGQYDLISTNAVIEHVDNVSNFADEIYRLLRGGYFYGIIHNFYSLSGGHNLEWAFPDEQPSQKVPPWDHLRANKYPSWVPLNRLLPEEYLKAFSKHLDVLLFEGRDINHDPGGFEGEQFLTPEIESELKEYPRDLLLTRGWCIICRKA